MISRVKTSEQSGPAWHAERARGCVICERNPLSSDKINAGSTSNRISATPQAIEALLICADEQNIWILHEYDIGYNNKLLAILCHVFYATLGFNVV
jgi:hypothetical protein